MKLKENAAFWNKRSEIFDQNVIPVYEDAYRKTIDFTKEYLKGTENVLDIGCGTGVTTIELSSCVAHLTAVDTSPDMMKQAEQKAGKAGIGNIDFLLTDMNDPVFEAEQFDAVMIFNVLLYIREQQAAVDRLFRLLKPGGRLFLAADCLKFSPTKEAFGKWLRSRTGRMPYVAFYTQESLKNLLINRGFTLLMSRNLHQSPPNLFLAAQKPDKRGIN